MLSPQEVEEKRQLKQQEYIEKETIRLINYIDDNFKRPYGVTSAYIQVRILEVVPKKLQNIIVQKYEKVGWSKVIVEVTSYGFLYVPETIFTFYK